MSILTGALDCSFVARHATAKSARVTRVRDEARALYRKAILDAAEAVFAEKGVHVARVQDIAARAGLSVGAIYNYFEQKEDVLIALLAERVADLVERFEAHPGDPKGFTERLVARVTRFLAYVDEHRAFFQVASDQGLLGPGATSAEKLAGKGLQHKVRFEKAVESLVAEGIAKGHLAGDAGFLALHLRHTLKSASLWRRTNPDVTHPEAAELAVAAYLGGVGKKKR
jgi:AcrR family transcriptional regulator